MILHNEKNAHVRLGTAMWECKGGRLKMDIELSAERCTGGAKCMRDIPSERTLSSKD